MSVTETYALSFLICCAFSAFFSSSETAFISIQRYRVEHLLASGVVGAERVARLLHKPEKLLSTVLFGNTLVNTAAASLGTAVAVVYFGENGVFYATLIVTVILLIFCEVT
ncbi:CNNM domain-containing protein, partial [Chloroflexota bacterium]